MEGNATSSSGVISKKKEGGRRGLPSPRELIAHYESKGMDTQEAAVKVIEDLQNALFRRLVLDNNKKKKNTAGGGGDTSTATISRKLDVINSRLIQLDMKVESKPGYPQTLAIGVASGAIGTIIPHLAASFAHIWNSVTNFTGGR